MAEDDRRAPRSPATIKEGMDAWKSKTAEEIEADGNLLQKQLLVFGTDVGQIPCFRNSFLYGIGGGFGTGLAHFAVSSKVRNATRFGFWTYVGITAAYWCHCRYEYTMLKQEYARLQYALKHAAARDGTSDGMPREPRADVS